MDVVFLVGSILLAIGLVSVLGLPLGMLAWLLAYGLFRFLARKVLDIVGGPTG